ncbi:MAG: HAMP domain-containing histidine kinase, partial [Actinomycetota bacterium]|nr:HAMP domain-containing histidine kinase [Actinomycetota bacterium]
VIGDAARIRQVMDNLLSNVRAHTPPGTSTRVRIAIADGYGTIEVADNGPGLPDATHSLVFERFYRLDSSRSRNSGGSGLGLAIVAAIVAAQHGRVAAIPTEGGGATFTVSLPLATAAALGDGRPLPASDEEVWAPAPAPAPSPPPAPIEGGG